MAHLLRGVQGALEGGEGTGLWRRVKKICSWRARTASGLFLEVLWRITCSPRYVRFFFSPAPAARVPLDQLAFQANPLVTGMCILCSVRETDQRRPRGMVRSQRL